MTINDINKTMKRVPNDFHKDNTNTLIAHKEKEIFASRLNSGRKQKVKIHYGKNRKDE